MARIYQFVVSQEHEDPKSKPFRYRHLNILTSNTFVGLYSESVWQLICASLSTKVKAQGLAKVIPAVCHPLPLFATTVIPDFVQIYPKYLGTITTKIDFLKEQMEWSCQKSF